VVFITNIGWRRWQQEAEVSRLWGVPIFCGAQLDEAFNSQNPTGRFHSKAIVDILSVGGKLKTEIPVYLASARQDLGFLKGW
jgi:hypothetical protein